MGSIGWYIFRTTLSAFWLICGSLTLIVWLDSAVRDLDLMTSQGQTIMAFLGLMSLAIPQLILIISPIAFMIAASEPVVPASPAPLTPSGLELHGTFRVSNVNAGTSDARGSA